MSTKVHIFDLAARAIGAGGITSTEGPDSVSRNLRAFYDVILDARLSGNRWTFAWVRRSLNKLTSVPLNRYSHEFQLPADTLQLWAVYPNTDYQLIGKRIQANVTELDADLTMRPSEGDFPPWFTRALYLELAASIAMPVTQNENLAARLEMAARDAWASAMNIDAQQDPVQAIQESPFTDVRSL